jgi:hypothetical protein
LRRLVTRMRGRPQRSAVPVLSRPWQLESATRPSVEWRPSGILHPLAVRPLLAGARPRDQTSVCSAISRAPSTSIPRYLTVLKLAVPEQQLHRPMSFPLFQGSRARAVRIDWSMTVSPRGPSGEPVCVWRERSQPDPEETLVLVQSRQSKENKRPFGVVAGGSIVVTIDPREDDQHHLNSRPRWGLPRRARRSTRVSANSWPRTRTRASLSSAPCGTSAGSRTKL